MKTRKCSACSTAYDLNMFPGNKKEKGGKGYLCRSCENKRCVAWQRTKDGVTSVIYTTQKASSKRRGHAKPTYSLNDLRDWLYAQPDFHLMFDNWKRLDYQRWYKPSVDRKDDSLGYTMSNIQLMTWKENSDKRVLQLKEANAINNHKKVMQISLIDGSILNTFNSMGIASRETGIGKQNISAVCRGTRGKAGGFKWQYLIKRKG